VFGDPGKTNKSERIEPPEEQLSLTPSWLAIGSLIVFDYHKAFKSRYLLHHGGDLVKLPWGLLIHTEIIDPKERFLEGSLGWLKGFPQLLPNNIIRIGIIFLPLWLMNWTSVIGLFTKSIWLDMVVGWRNTAPLTQETSVGSSKLRNPLSFKSLYARGRTIK
jgi:hypothetical protein